MDKIQTETLQKGSLSSGGDGVRNHADRRVATVSTQAVADGSRCLDADDVFDMEGGALKVFVHEAVFVL